MKRRIPPKSVDDLAAELMDNPDISAYDALILANQMHDQAMEEIYRLARIGEASEGGQVSELTTERAVRVLRAKAAELEAFVKDDYESNDRYPTHLRPPRMTDLTAAVALIAQLLADLIERSGDDVVHEAMQKLGELEQKFKEGFDESRPPGDMMSP